MVIPMSLDNFVQSEIEHDIRRIQEILACGIFQAANSRHPLFLSALTELLIALRDLLAKAEKYASRVAFSDDVIIQGKVNDVTDLVKFVRDALCHIDSGKHTYDEIQARFSFNVAFGKARIVVQAGDVRVESPYEDDIAFFFGPQRLLLQRHIIRAFNEATEKLRPLLDFP
jgi:hypothetical protein